MLVGLVKLVCTFGIMVVGRRVVVRSVACVPEAVLLARCDAIFLSNTNLPVYRYCHCKATSITN